MGFLSGRGMGAFADAFMNSYRTVSEQNRQQKAEERAAKQQQLLEDMARSKETREQGLYDRNIKADDANRKLALGGRGLLSNTSSPDYMSVSQYASPDMIYNVGNYRTPEEKSAIELNERKAVSDHEFSNRKELANLEFANSKALKGMVAPQVTAAMTEYDFAKKNGYSGGFMDFVKDKTVATTKATTSKSTGLNTQTNKMLGEMASKYALPGENPDQLYSSILDEYSGSDAKDPRAALDAINSINQKYSTRKQQFSALESGLEKAGSLEKLADFQPKNPDEVKSLVASGKLTKEEGMYILITQFGADL